MIYLLLITVKNTVYLLITRDQCFNKLISILFVIQKSLLLLLPKMLTFVFQASVKRFRHFAPPHPPNILSCDPRELKHRNISSRRRSIFREWTGSRTAFFARIFNLSITRMATTDARRVKRCENYF